MYFRPLPRLTLVCIPLFFALIALGVWQLERLQWKLGLIAEMQGHVHAQPLNIDDIMRLPPQEAEYRRVALSGRYENAREAFVYTSADGGIAVYHVIAPFRLDDGRVFLVDRGVIPLALKDPRKRSAGQLAGEQRLVGVWRTPDKPGTFTPSPDLANRVWYARDLAGMARTMGVSLARPVIVEADATPNPGGWPKGGQTMVSLPNDHLQYALTWFLMAAGLVVVYLAYHRGQGRLRFGPPRS